MAIIACFWGSSEKKPSSSPIYGIRSQVRVAWFQPKPEKSLLGGGCVGPIGPPRNHAVLAFKRPGFCGPHEPPEPPGGPCVPGVYGVGVGVGVGRGVYGVGVGVGMG